MYFSVFSANEEKVVDMFMEIKRCPADWNGGEDSIKERYNAAQEKQSALKCITELNAEHTRHLYTSTIQAEYQIINDVMRS